MSITKIFKIEEVDLNRLLFLNAFKSNETCYIPILYDSRPLFIQLPSLFVDDIKPGKITLLLKGKNNETTDRIISFFNTLDNIVKNELDKLLKKFKHVITLSEGSVFKYNRFVCELTDEESITNFILLDINDYLKCYNNNKELIDIELFRGSYAGSIIEVSNIIIDKNIINISIKLHQLRISNPSLMTRVLDTYSFVDVDSDEEGERESVN